MKTLKYLAAASFIASVSFAADAAPAAPAAENAAAPAAEKAVAPADTTKKAEPSVYDVCMDSLNAIEAKIPANAWNTKLTLLEAKAMASDIQNELKNNPKADVKAKGENCLLYAEIIKTEVEVQEHRTRIAENWEKRNATNRSIETIQEEIANARSGKVSNLAADLEAERQRLAQTKDAMKDQEAKLQAEMQQNRDKFLAEAAEREAALKAAGEREADLQKKLEAEHAALEAEKKALAEERAKAEARQKEAMNKLNELQSKLIQVSQDARGIILSMSDILFDVDKATLKQDLKTSLAKVAGILTVYQQFNVSIEGNTDNTGSADHNMKLSQQRADNVKNFLVEQGIDAGRLSAKGLGMTMPIADNSTKEGRQKNRRVDLVIQDKVLQESAEPEKTPEQK